MSDQNFARTLTAMILSISLTPLFGCSGEPNPTTAPHSASYSASRNCTAAEDSALGGMSCQLGISVTTASPALQSELRNLLTTYMLGLQSNDVATAEKVISTELRGRIETRGPNANFASNLQIFVSREQRKLIRNVETPDALRKPFTITSSEILTDGSVAAIRFAIDGKTFPKPFYFILEDGNYKLNVVQPSIVPLEGNTYLVANADAVARTFSCSGASSLKVAANSSVHKFCSDSCPGFFDGTRFTVNGASADCDFNTFGTDMTIKNNSPVCHDPC